MTQPPGLHILMCNDAVTGIDGSRARVPSLCVNPDDSAAQPRRCSDQRAVS
jgi:hypothetical protein